MTVKEIKKLRPTFDFYGMEMVDWFKIMDEDSFCEIRSGLRHSDPEIKSPFFYEDCVIGKGAKKEALKEFQTWWERKNDT
jgi:hypothetical protein